MTQNESNTLSLQVDAKKAAEVAAMLLSKDLKTMDVKQFLAFRETIPGVHGAEDRELVEAAGAPEGILPEEGSLQCVGILHIYGCQPDHNQHMEEPWLHHLPRE